jgi:hypothetical protein
LVRWLHWWPVNGSSTQPVVCCDWFFDSAGGLWMVRRLSQWSAVIGSLTPPVACEWFVDSASGLLWLVRWLHWWPVSGVTLLKQWHCWCDTFVTLTRPMWHFCNTGEPGPTRGGRASGHGVQALPPSLPRSAACRPRRNGQKWTNRPPRQCQPQDITRWHW